jgi:chitodextrinase
VAVDENPGPIYTSSDSGITWTPRLTDANRYWKQLSSSSDGVKLVALAYNDKIYISSDSGITWKGRESNRNWLACTSSSDGVKLVAAVGGNSDGQIYTSSDSGVTWIPRESNRNWRGVASSSDGVKLVALAFAGQIYTSTDSGVTWIARESIRRWYGVASSSDGVKLVAVDYGINNVGGKIYTSPDSGITWTPRDATRQWTSVASSADGSKLVATAYAGQIYTSTDSGENWSARESNRNWNSVTSSSDGVNLVAVVYDGLIYTSSDSGLTWRPNTAIAPLAPQISLAGATETSLIIDWIGAAGAQSYTYSLSPNQGTYVATPVGGTGRIIWSGLTRSTSYTITITAINTWGSLAGTLTRSTEGPPIIGSTSSTGTTITLNWTAPSQPVTSYQIALEGQAYTITTSATTYTITGLSLNTSYTYQIRSQNAAGNSSAVSFPAVTTAATLSPPKNGPTSVNNTNTILNWVSSTDTNDYEIGLQGQAYTITTTGTTYTITGLSPNTSYTYQLRAKFGTAFSSAILYTFTTSAQPIQYVYAPMTMSNININNGNLSFSFTTPSYNGMILDMLVGKVYTSDDPNSGGFAAIGPFSSSLVIAGTFERRNIYIYISPIFPNGITGLYSGPFYFNI